jgi:hypothetical protein
MTPRDEALRESLEQYRRRAEECRAAANKGIDDGSRCAFLLAAGSWDLLATMTKLELGAIP